MVTYRRWNRPLLGAFWVLLIALLPACSIFSSAPSDGPVVATPVIPEVVTPPPVAPPVAAPAPSAPAPSPRKSAPPDVVEPPLPGAEKANIRVGDKLWYRGGGTGQRVATIVREAVSIQSGEVRYKQSDVDVGGQVSPRSRARRQSLRHLELDTPAKAAGLMKFVDFPMGVGKSWNFRYQLKGKNGALVTYDVMARVESEETITTPAGSFETLRISHVGKWSAPVVTGSGLTNSSGTLRSTLWFARSLGNWAKFESEIFNSKGGADVKVRQELIRFERKAD
jgi:hypothetical protein